MNKLNNKTPKIEYEIKSIRVSEPLLEKLARTLGKTTWMFVGLPCDNEFRLWKNAYEKGEIIMKVVKVKEKLAGVYALAKSTVAYVDGTIKTISNVFEEYVIISTKYRRNGLYKAIRKDFKKEADQRGITIVSVPKGNLGRVHNAFYILMKKDIVKDYKMFLYLNEKDEFQQYLSTVSFTKHELSELSRYGGALPLAKGVEKAWEEDVRNGEAKKLGVHPIEGTYVYVYPAGRI